MNVETFSNALGELDLTYIDQAYRYRRKAKNRVLPFIAAAACLAVVISALTILRKSPESSTGVGAYMTEDGVVIPPTDIRLPRPGETYNMIAFFIYQGRVYTFYRDLEGRVDLMGEWLGTADGSIGEYNAPDSIDDCAELSGSVGGDVYTVDGCDPSFMLCMNRHGDTLELYVCSSGLTVKYGSEILEDRLHVSENLDRVEYETRASWNAMESEGEPHDIRTLPPDAADALESFIRAADEAEFMLTEDIPLEEGQDLYDGMELYHMYLYLTNGIPIELRLLKNGYVRIENFYDITLQVPAPTFTALLSYFET